MAKKPMMANTTRCGIMNPVKYFFYLKLVYLIQLSLQIVIKLTLNHNSQSIIKNSQ